MGDRIVSREEWLPARLALLAREKELSRLRDAVNAERLALPRVRIDKDYRFETPAGPASLADLFDGRSQLVVYHFMFAPGWEEGCPGCSFMADHLDGTLAHLNNHDVTLVVVSQAPLAKLEAYKRRMGWRFPWVSSFGSDFNADFGVSFTAEELARGGATYNYTPLRPGEGMEELHGESAFVRDESGQVFHTYSSYARAAEEWASTLMILDRAPKGRNETGTLSFVKRHDEYGAAPTKGCCAA